MVEQIRGKLLFADITIGLENFRSQGSIFGSEGVCNGRKACY